MGKTACGSDQVEPRAQLEGERELKMPEVVDGVQKQRARAALILFLYFAPLPSQMGLSAPTIAGLQDELSRLQELIEKWTPRTSPEDRSQKRDPNPILSQSC